MKTLSKIKEVYSAEQIQSRICQMGAQISQDYKNIDNLVIIGVIKGAIFFLADLTRKIRSQSPLQIEFVRLSSYGKVRV